MICDVNPAFISTEPSIVGKLYYFFNEYTYVTCISLILYTLRNKALLKYFMFILIVFDDNILSKVNTLINKLFGNLTFGLAF